MNYNSIYNSLINRARGRLLTGYTETHHIKPRCMGGKDQPENLVELTAREHFIAHLLLVKMYPSNLKLVKAVAMMCIGQKERKLTNRLYGKLRLMFSKSMAESQAGEKNSQFGTKWIHNPLTLETKKIKVSETIQEGWEIGRAPKIKRIKSTVSKRLQKRNEQILLYRKYYLIYKDVGFEEFVRITGYSSTKQNLVQRFSKLLEEFIPQNGKRRGSSLCTP